MILDDIAYEYGVDTSIAFKFASNDSKKLLMNLRYFLDKYSDMNYVMAVLFGDNTENVFRFIAQLKKDSKLVGAYTLHMLCCELPKNNCITVESAKEVRNSLKRVTEFWRLYIPGNASGTAGKYDELLLDLLKSVRAAVGNYRNAGYALVIGDAHGKAVDIEASAREQSGNPGEDSGMVFDQY